MRQSWHSPSRAVGVRSSQVRQQLDPWRRFRASVPRGHCSFRDVCPYGLKCVAHFGNLFQTFSSLGVGTTCSKRKGAARGNPAGLYRQGRLRLHGRFETHHARGRGLAAVRCSGMRHGPGRSGRAVRICSRGCHSQGGRSGAVCVSEYGRRRPKRRRRFRPKPCIQWLICWFFRFRQRRQLQRSSRWQRIRFRWQQRIVIGPIGHKGTAERVRQCKRLFVWAVIQPVQPLFRIFIRLGGQGSFGFRRCKDAEARG